MSDCYEYIFLYLCAYSVKFGQCTLSYLHFPSDFLLSPSLCLDMFICILPSWLPSFAMKNMTQGSDWSILRQKMGKMNSSKHISKNQNSSFPALSILAQDVSKLAINEKEIFSPILKRWHPLAAGVAVATLHSCYGNELKQYITGISELTPDAIQVLRAADNLEKDLVQIAVEDAVDSEDGGKSIIQEMPPYEAESVIANLVRSWIKTRVDRLKEWTDRNLQQEVFDGRFLFGINGMQWFSLKSKFNPSLFTSGFEPLGCKFDMDIILCELDMDFFPFLCDID